MSLHRDDDILGQACGIPREMAVVKLCELLPFAALEHEAVMAGDTAVDRRSQLVEA
jgi:hypothetical protein